MNLFGRLAQSIMIGLTSKLQLYLIEVELSIRVISNDYNSTFDFTKKIQALFCDECDSLPSCPYMGSTSHAHSAHTHEGHTAAAYFAT